MFRSEVTDTRTGSTGKLNWKPGRLATAARSKQVWTQWQLQSVQNCSHLSIDLRHLGD